MGLPKGTHLGWDVIVPGTAQKDKQTQYPALEAWISESLESLSKHLCKYGLEDKGRTGERWQKTTVAVPWHLARLGVFLPSWSLSREGCTAHTGVSNVWNGTLPWPVYLL